MRHNFWTYRLEFTEWKKCWRVHWGLEKHITKSECTEKVWQQLNPNWFQYEHYSLLLVRPFLVTYTDNILLTWKWHNKPQRQAKQTSFTCTFRETWLPRILQLASRRMRMDGQHACSFSTFRMRKSVEKRQLLRSRVSRLGQLSWKHVKSAQICISGCRVVPSFFNFFF